MRTPKLFFPYKNILLVGLAMVFLLMRTTPVEAQVLDDRTRIQIKLEDGTDVILMSQADRKSNDTTKMYYYLPVNPRLSVKPDGTPNFLFMKYTTEESATKGGVNGAVIHFLVEWGLTNKQHEELKQKLADRVKGARLMGAAEVLPAEGGSFQVISATLDPNNKEWVPTFITSGHAPMIPGAKAAIAANLQANAAQLLAATFEESSSISDITLAMNFKYKILLPAFEANIKINWEKVDSFFRSHSAEVKYDYDYDAGEVKHDKSFSSTQVDSIYHEMRETGVIQGDIFQDTEIDNETVNQISQAVLQLMIEALLTPMRNQVPAVPNSVDSTGVNHPSYSDMGSDDVHYTFDMQKYQERRSIINQSLNFNYRVAIPREMTVTANLAEWYDFAKDEKGCVSDVLLNDPFFQHRTINFILDLDAEDIFQEEVNFVSVTVKKERTNGQDFIKSETIDRKFVKDNGIRASIEFSKAKDEKPGEFLYMTKWSLRGGNTYPPNPKWQRGDFDLQSISLTPPVLPRTIEMEADLAEFEELNISRATAQVRYRKYDKEFEENIHLYPSKEEPIVSSQIFVDKNSKGYAYRLILNHKTEGKLVMPWQPITNDDYIYVVIPSEFRDPVSEVFEEAKSRAAQGTNVMGEILNAVGELKEQFKKKEETNLN
jgi:hypothetical protein